ncbi:MAG TPA: response regulator [Terriglobia bacterium]|nr:response regulator [Terriglobia bacterium]
MAERILAVVDDLFFLAKIQQTARQLNVALETAAPDAVVNSLAAGGASAILLDLNHRSGAAMDVLKALKGDATTSRIPVVAFLSHVQADLAKAARAAGCDVVLARSAFSQQLPSLLMKLSQGKPPEPSSL